MEILKLGKEEESDVEKVNRILKGLPDYFVKDSKFGTMFLSAGGEDPETVVFNCPANLFPVFPAEDRDIFERKDYRKAMENSYRFHHNEGGNELVFYHLIGARLKLLDLEKWKRQIRYCMLPNRTCGDRVLMSGGRYQDNSDFNFMMRMGIWVENFALYSVLNECMLSGHDEVKEVFPNWDLNVHTTFVTLRTAGAFLFDGECGDGKVLRVRVRAEKAGKLQLVNPWRKGEILSFDMGDGEVAEWHSEEELKQFVNTKKVHAE